MMVDHNKREVATWQLTKVDRGGRVKKEDMERTTERKGSLLPNQCSEQSLGLNMTGQGE